MAEGKKAKPMKINFEGVDKEIKKGGGGGIRVPEGDYLFKIIEATVHENKAQTGSYLRWKLTFHEGDAKGKSIYTNTSLKPEALWNLRNLIHAALGRNVAGKAINFDPSKLYGKIVGASVIDGDEYKGRIKSEIQTFMPREEVKGGDDEEEDEAEVEVEEEEDEELEDVEVEDL